MEMRMELRQLIPCVWCGVELTRADRASARGGYPYSCVCGVSHQICGSCAMELRPIPFHGGTASICLVVPEVRAALALMG